MVFKKYRIVIISKLFLIILNFGLLIIAFHAEGLYATIFVLISFFIIQIVLLIRYTEKIFNNLAEFLYAFKNKDFMGSYSKNNNAQIDSEIKQSLDYISNEFRKIRIEKEMRNQYLYLVVENIKIAMFCIDNQGNVQFINKAAKQFFKRKSLKNIHSIESWNPLLYETICNLSGNERKILKIRIENENMSLVLQAIEFKMKDRLFKIVNIQNFRSELENQELESWQKLTKVLTHEIMNSITPVMSLTEALKSIIENEEGMPKSIEELNSEDINDIYESLKTIAGRSRGLMKFVLSYKEFTGMPKPEFEEIDIQALIQHLIRLILPEYQKDRIEISFAPLPQNVNIIADSELVEQMLINILINARDAMKNIDHKKVEIVIAEQPNLLIIEISNNGEKIPPENIDRIFIPFFTTKSTGCGIGLSMARQIMSFHKGNISVFSESHKTTFRLEFPL